MNQKKEWEDFFGKSVSTEWYPSEPVIRLLCSYHKKHGSAGVKVLDLGCGNGRHVWLAAKEGFSAYGIDLSENAIELAKAWLEKENLPYQDLRSGDVASSLPFADGFFDIVISYGVLDHMPIEDALRATGEIKRVLKNGGLVFLKLESTTSFTFDPQKQVRKNEIVLDKEAERSIMQHYFDREEVVRITSGFQAVQFFRDDYRRFEDMGKNYQSRWIFIGRKV